MLRDTDSVDSAERIRTAVWSVLGGIVSGFGGALLYGFPGFLAGWILGAVTLWFAVLKLADRAGRLGEALYLTRGASTPAAREYSLGDALVARGRFAEAAAEFERCAALYATDAEPRFRLARLLRDRVRDPEAAARWFRSILEIASLDPAGEALASRELAELFIHGLDQPERALPVLARLGARQPETAAGRWARATILDIKSRMRDPS